MPNETHLKRLISDAIFEAHNTHGAQAARKRLQISREDSRIIARAVFDALRRANVSLLTSLVRLALEALRPRRRSDQVILAFSLSGKPH